MRSGLILYMSHTWNVFWRYCVIYYACVVTIHGMRSGVVVFYIFACGMRSGVIVLYFWHVEHSLIFCAQFILFYIILDL